MDCRVTRILRISGRWVEVRSNFVGGQDIRLAGIAVRQLARQFRAQGFGR
jgi:hypothetical protein